MGNTSDFVIKNECLEKYLGNVEVVVIPENVTIDGHNISDVNSFVNELQNIKGIALQRAYRK